METFGWIQKGEEKPMSDVECPYCGEEQEICHDDGYGFEESKVHQQECSCGRTFGFTTQISYDYEVLKLPCANGKEHKWLQRKIYPECFAMGEFICEFCGEHKHKYTEEREKAIKEYFATLNGKIGVATFETDAKETPDF